MLLSQTGLRHQISFGNELLAHLVLCFEQRSL